MRAQAYPGVAYEYDNQATLLYSEIDPDLHAAVATGKYGVPCPAATPDCGNPTSTINYAPKYFLVNGQPFPSGTPVIAPAGNPGTTLLRLLNAGLTTHVPMIQGTHWTVVAEDGKPYPYRPTQYTALLPAGEDDGRAVDARYRRRGLLDHGSSPQPVEQRARGWRHAGVPAIQRAGGRYRIGWEHAAGGGG